MFLPHSFQHNFESTWKVNDLRTTSKIWYIYNILIQFWNWNVKNFNSILPFFLLKQVEVRCSSGPPLDFRNPTFPKKKPWFFWEKTPRIRRMRFHHHHHHETACHVRRVLAFPNSNFKPLGSVPLDMPFWRGTRFYSKVFVAGKAKGKSNTNETGLKLKELVKRSEDDRSMIDQYSWILI